MTGDPGISCGVVARLLIVIVRIYRRLLSPLLPPMCRFHPSCSQYFIEAVQVRGALVGVFLGLWRILRCNPLSRGGHDPVPPKDRPAIDA